MFFNNHFNNNNNFNDDVSDNLIKTIPQVVILQLEKSLNKPGPSNWNVLLNLISEEYTGSIFNPEELQQLQENPKDKGCSYLLKLLCQKNLKIRFLLNCLHSLPCQCSWKLLHKYLVSISPTNSQQQSTTHSLPSYNTLSENPNEQQQGNLRMPSSHRLPENQNGNITNSNPISLPSNFEFAEFHAQKSVISEHPKKHQTIKCGDEILLKCSVKASSRVHFQWYFMSRPIDGQTTHLLLVPEAQLCDEGFYRCKITVNNKPELSDWAFVSVGAKNSICMASDKIALLIANENYDNHKQLPAASRDVEVLTNILQKELNFKTFSFVNLNFVEIHRALQWLCSIAKTGCYCVFYFGGHGYENDGKCFLVPVDAPTKYCNANCINAHTELENIQRRCKPNLMLILLDICRKRNWREVERIPCSATSFNPNVVLAYATMESREAFERRNEQHGVFVNSLRKHLSKDERVNFMLTHVQDDIRTSGLQIAEVRTTLVEERCLTDPVEPRSESCVNAAVKEYIKWQSVHNLPSPDPLITQIGRNKALVEIRYRSILTNKIELTVFAREIDSMYVEHRLVIDPLSVKPNNISPQLVQPCNPCVMHLSNIQRAADRNCNQSISFTVAFLAKTREGKKEGRSFVETITPSFLNYWTHLNSHFIN